MKSKAHYKKCVELGLNPLPNSVDEDYEDPEEGSVTSSGGERAMNLAEDEDSDTDDMSEGDDNENESSGKIEIFYFVWQCRIKRNTIEALFFFVRMYFSRC